jgi:hypothetical protein
MKKQQIALIALTLWLIMVSGAMILGQNINLETYVILVLIGFLVIVQFMELKFVQPGYLKSLRYLIAVGIVIFCGIVVHKVMEILVR